MKTREEELKDLIYKGDTDELINFLKSLSQSERKTLKPALKAVEESIPYGERHLEKYKKRSVGVSISSFVLEDTRTPGWHFHEVSDRDILLKILPWHQPTWFNKYINNLANGDGLPYWLTYSWMMEFTEKGFLDPSDELVATLLPNSIAIVGWDREKREQTLVFQPEVLEKYPISLEKHFWLLFEYPSDIHAFGRYAQVIKQEIHGWIPLIKKLVKEGKIDRESVLVSTLQTANQNFNRSLTNWFADLFVSLDVTEKELQSLQPQLFAVLSSPQSKPVKLALKNLKKIVHQPDFQIDSLLSQSDSLFQSEVKSVITATLSLFEKTAKSRPHDAPLLAQACCQAMCQMDANIQLRAAKLIIKYGQPQDPEIELQLSLFAESLTHEARNLLQPFLPHSLGTEELSWEAEELPSRLDPSFLIDEINSLEDFVFLASQAFDNNKSYHFDLVIDGLLRFQHSWDEQTLTQLSPAFQKAYTCLYRGGHKQTGIIDILLALFWITYFEKLHQRGTAMPAYIHASFANSIKMEKEEEHSRYAYTPLLKGFENWSVANDRAVYSLFKSRLQEALQLLERQHVLPLLATPTHGPHGINPLVLIQRMLRYQKAGEAWGAADFQIALSRVVLEDTSEALALATSQLTGEAQRLMRFLLDPKIRAEGPFDEPAAWWVAAMSKDAEGSYPALEALLPEGLDARPMRGNYSWAVLEHIQNIKNYDYSSGKHVEELQVTQELDVDFRLRDHQGRNSLFPYVEALGGKKGETAFFLYAAVPFMESQRWSIGLSANDLERFAACFANNPEPLYARIIKGFLGYISHLDVIEKEIGTKLLTLLYEQRAPYRSMSHLTIAIGMLHAEKNVRSIAAECWIQGVAQNRLNHQRLGAALGKLAGGGYAPLKRLTDNLSQHCWQLSGMHNQALFELLAACIVHFPSKPVKNTPKLLEMYMELLHVVEHAQVTADMRKKLESWKGIGSLKKGIRRILAVG